MTKAEFCEVNEITTQVRDLPTRIKGFSYHDDEGRFIVVLNARLPSATLHASADHELRHILRGDHDDLAYLEYGA